MSRVGSQQSQPGLRSLFNGPVTVAAVAALQFVSAVAQLVGAVVTGAAAVVVTGFAALALVAATVGADQLFKHRKLGRVQAKRLVVGLVVIAVMLLAGAIAYLATRPESRVIEVRNEVTNGPTDMREDDVPAFLSTRPQPGCRPGDCRIAGTELTTGMQITATCHVTGPRMTNGQDNSEADDQNPGLFESRLWYKAHTADGKEGYISEVYIHPDDHGGLGLLRC
ncbi:hypothetical protein [Micromonospora gifhornensis]|uniref:hypothetical protein n=1 Tax=Micromonospora gifhornensis TaxID=84594 RepID=UPI003D73E239